MSDTLSVHDIATLDLQRRPSLNFPWRPDIMAMQPMIKTAVDAYGQGKVTEAMLAAFINRETAFRNIFQEGMAHGPGCGVGPCQLTAGVDWTTGTPRMNGIDVTDVQSNLNLAVELFIVPALNEFPGSHQEAFDAYNLGSGGVADEILSGESPDHFTTGANYGRSVFESWITYASIALGVSVDWATWAPL